MTIDCRFVCEHQILFGSVRNGHDVDVGELRPALSPIRVRENMVTPDLASCFDLSSLGNAPMKERVVACNSSARGLRLHVLEKGREAPDDSALVEGVSDA